MRDRWEQDEHKIYKYYNAKYAVYMYDPSPPPPLLPSPHPIKNAYNIRTLELLDVVLSESVEGPDGHPPLKFVKQRKSFLVRDGAIERYSPNQRTSIAQNTIFVCLREI